MSNNTIISFTEVTVPGGALTKTISLDRDGKLQKTATADKLSYAKARITRIPFREYPEYIKGIQQDQAIISGVPSVTSNAGGCDQFEITTIHQFQGQPGFTTRTKNNFVYPTDTCGLGMIDYDYKEGRRHYSPEELIDIFSAIIPDFKAAAKCITSSTSSGIYNGDIELRSKKAGCHIYLPVANGADFPRFTKVLFKRLGLEGHSFIYIAKSGTQLIRSLIDEAVASPERIIFEAPAICTPPLTQHRPDPIYIEGGVLDTTVLPDLTEEEERSYREKAEVAKEKTRDQAKKAKDAYIDAHSLELYNERKVSAKPVTLRQARILVDKRTQGELTANDVLEFDDFGRVTVTEVLSNPAKYERQYLCDPLEPEAGRCKALFFSNLDTGRPLVYSYLHGGCRFYLNDRKSADDVKQDLLALKQDNKGSIAMDKAYPVIRDAELSSPDLKAVLAFLASEGLGGKRELSNEYRRLRNLEEAEAQKKRLEYDADGRRMVKERHHELNKMIDETEQAILENQTDTAYFLFGGLLCYDTVDYINVASQSSENGQKDKISQIKPYTVNSLNLRVDESVMFYRSKMVKRGVEKQEPIAVPKSILNCLLENTHPKAPVVNGLITCPTILPDGRIIDDEGIDEPTGLLLRKNGVNFAPVPEHPTLEDAKRALDGLIDSLFREFEFRETDSDSPENSLYGISAVSMLLTGIIRKVVDQAPGYLITANIQGSGKTTLVQIIHLLLTRSFLSVSSISDSQEEMNKQLLATFSRSPAAVCYDNVRDGDELRDTVLAKAITSPFYTGRILGMTKEVTLPTSTLFAITGNNVTLSADLVRRFLTIELSPMTERPETRNFDVINIEGHCKRLQREAIHNALVIIKAYIANGSPLDSAGKRSSGFPMWDRLVRFPLLWTSGIDIADTIHRNYTHSTEQTSFNGLLECLYEMYGMDEFSASRLHEDLRTTPIYSPDPDDREVLNAKDLREHLTNLAPKALESTRSLGRVLKRAEGRIHNNKRLNSTPSRNHTNSYSIQIIQQP